MDHSLGSRLLYNDRAPWRYSVIALEGDGFLAVFGRRNRSLLDHSDATYLGVFYGLAGEPAGGVLRLRDGILHLCRQNPLYQARRFPRDRLFYLGILALPLVLRSLCFRHLPAFLVCL